MSLGGTARIAGPVRSVATAISTAPTRTCRVTSGDPGGQLHPEQILRTDGHDPPVRQRPQVVRPPVGILELVRGEADGQPTAAALFLERLVELQSGRAVGGARRLVQQQHVRLEYHRPCHRHPLDLAFGKLAAWPAQQATDRELAARRHRPGRPAPRAPTPLAAQSVVPDSRARCRGTASGRCSTRVTRRRVAAVRGARWPSSQTCASARRLEQRGEAQQRALPGAVGPDDRHDGAARHDEVVEVEDGTPLIAMAHAAQLKHGRDPGAPATPRSRAARAATGCTRAPVRGRSRPVRCRARRPW